MRARHDLDRAHRLADVLRGELHLEGGRLGRRGSSCGRLNVCVPPLCSRARQRDQHPALDEAQRRALHGALIECKRVCLISGPAGAGKSDEIWFMLKVLGKDGMGVMAPTRGATRSNQETVDKALPRRSFKPELEVLTTYGGVGVGYKETFHAPTIVAAIKRKDAKKAKAAAFLKKRERWVSRYPRDARGMCPHRAETRPRRDASSRD